MIFRLQIEFWISWIIQIEFSKINLMILFWMKRRNETCFYSILFWSHWISNSVLYLCILFLRYWKNIYLIFQWNRFIWSEWEFVLFLVRKELPENTILVLMNVGFLSWYKNRNEKVITGKQMDLFGHLYLMSLFSDNPRDTVPPLCSFLWTEWLGCLKIKWWYTFCSFQLCGCATQMEFDSLYIIYESGFIFRFFNPLFRSSNCFTMYNIF